MDELQKSDGISAKSGQPEAENAFYHKGLTPPQERAVTALLESPSITAAASQAEVGERSLRRWLSENDNFKQSLRRAREQSLAHATARLQGASVAAVNHLSKALEDVKHIEPGRATLIRAAIEFAFKISAHMDFVERLEALEQNDSTFLED